MQKMRKVALHKSASESSFNAKKPHGTFAEYNRAKAHFEIVFFFWFSSR